MHKVTIYTDGACKGNPGPSGWAYCITMSNSPDKYAIRSGCIVQGTNNIAELTAVIEALSALKYSCMSISTLTLCMLSMVVLIG